MLAIVAAADYLFQYRQWHERQRMTLRELKEEFKQSEGDPAIKGKMKQVRQVRMRFALTDRMVERATGRTVEDGGPGEVTELWTFMRASGGGWLVSAVQQA